MDINEIKNDMWALTEFQTEHVQKAKKTTNEKRPSRARKFLRGTEDDEDIEICAPVRGRPVGWEKYVPKPGASKSFDSYKKNVSEQIREVSGLSYSNDYILHNLGYEAAPISKEFSDAEDESSKSDDSVTTMALHDILKRGRGKKKNETKNEYEKNFPPL